MAILGIPSTGITDSTATGRSIVTAANAAAAATAAGVGTGDSPQFTAINVGHASDTTVTRSAAGVIAVEGIDVPLNSTSATHTASTIELGHATDTTLSRSSAGVLAVEGVTVPLNSTSSTHTASTIELGHASDTTLSRVSAGVAAIEGATIRTGTVGPTVGGTGLTSYTLGDTLHASATDTLAKLAGNTAAIPKIEVQTGNGTISAAPVRRALFSTRLASTFTVTSSTSAVVVTGLEANVEASKKYGFRFSGWADALVSSGVRYTMNGSATMTSLRFFVVIGTSSGIAIAGQAATLGTVIGVTAFTAGWVEISGTCEVNAAGTLGVYFAQNASGGTGSSVYSGSSFEVWELTN